MLTSGVGAFAGNSVTTATNVICIGENVFGANVNNSCYVGNIFGQSIDPATATLVGVDANNKLGTIASSKRFKDDIKPMDKASEALLALKPVTFHYKSDSKATPQFGLIAEEVDDVNPNLVVRDKNGKILTVRYDQVNAMLLNEFLKEHRNVEEQGCKLDSQSDVIQAQQATIAELKSTLAQQQKSFQSQFAMQEKQMEALAVGLQKVSAQLEVNRPRPQVVVNDP